MLDNNKIINKIKEAPKTIDYNEEIAVEQLKGNLGLMEMKKTSIIGIKNEYKDIDEKIDGFSEKWMKRIEAQLSLSMMNFLRKLVATRLRIEKNYYQNC